VKSFKQQSQAVNLVLFEHWDPIGVHTTDHEHTKDEYSGYVPQLIGLVVQRATDAQIAELLGTLESHNMGLRVSPMVKRLEVAARIRAAVLGGDAEQSMG
jgi:hypothetical protein